ncbi:MAG: hypothetical protein H6719_11610 [Sandaracinaceae bacterium]|nr:hypothetical protein [Sandaracinaceae bacterium]
MLTLDTLRRMADRMPTEPQGSSGEPPFRRPDAALRTRELRLPTVRDEARRARRLFAFVVIVALAVLVPAGVLVNHAADLWAGTASPAAVLRTALWLAAWTAAGIVPFAGFGLWREVRRFREARERVGDLVTLESSGILRSADGERTYPLGASRARVSAARRG